MLNDLKAETLLYLLSCKGNIELYWQNILIGHLDLIATCQQITLYVIGDI